ncbi:MAG: thiamine pyrophosphate-binding protein [Clostridia bacterium]|jgi:acetolactate synthase-1/2/3 large subunit|nr:thiamine pyrophosphate-binding protein [Clostridia bacterium]
MAKFAEGLIQSLASLGVKRIFGVPGGPSIPYMEAMRNNGMDFVLVSNEQSAGFMAEVTGRLTGIPGVCHATFGPGATNLTTGVGGALLDRSPLLALTTEVKDEELGRKVQMNIDHQALYRPLTKWTARLTAQNFKETVANAFEIATAEAPGPVHLGLPANIDAAELPSSSLVKEFTRTPLPMPETKILAEAEKIIRQAQKPVLAIGLTAVRLGLQQEIRKFVSQNRIPVYLTPMAKGMIVEDHPCYAGVLFHAKSDISAQIYRQADLVIGLGYDPIEFNYESWMPACPLVHFDTTPADVAPSVDVAYDVTGDPAVSLGFLNSLQLPAFTWDLESIGANKQRMLQELCPQTSSFTPADLCKVLRKVMPADSLLTADVGAHLHLLGQIWPTPEPNRLIMTNGWSSMGYGIPAAIGAKLCKPQRPVACLMGDGGFLMNCGELLTARRLGLNVVFIVLCDRNLSLIEVKQAWQNVPPYGTDLYEGDYFAADHFLGVPVFKAHDESEAGTALHKAFSCSGPAIIEAVVDGSVYHNLITRSYK